MLDAMRKSAKSFGMKFVLMMIVLTFVFMGAGSFLSRNPGEVATVNGESIFIEELQREYTNMIETLRQQFGGKLDEELLKMLNVEQQALNSLIDKKLLMQIADENSLRVPDETLTDRITGISAFHTNGRFDHDKYNLLLNQNNFTPRQFESLQKESILLEQVQNFIINAVTVSETEAQAWFEWENTEANIEYVTFSPDDFNDIDVSEADINAYYEENSNKFRVPEQIKVRFIRFNPEEFVDEADVTDQEITAYMESYSGEDKSEEEIRNLLARQRSGDIAYERAMEMYDISFDGEDMVLNAEKFGYEINTTNFFTREDGPDNFAENSDIFAEEAFELSINHISEIFEINGIYYLIQPIEKKEAHIPELEDVRADVVEAVQAQKLQRAAEKAAVAFLEDIRDTGDFIKAAENQKYTIASTGYFTRKESVPEVGRVREFTQAAFELNEENPIHDSPIKILDKFVVIRLAEKVVPGEAEFDKHKDQTMRQLVGRKQQETLGNWMANLRESSTIEIADRYARQFNL